MNMSYTLTEETELPRARQNKASPALYNDIIKVFLENQYTIASVTVEGKNLDVVHRRLDSRATKAGISVYSRGDKVYLVNNALVEYDEQCDNPPKGGW